MMQSGECSRGSPRARCLFGERKAAFELLWLCCTLFTGAFVPASTRNGQAEEGGR